MSDGPRATPGTPRVYGAAPWERRIEPAGSHPDIETAHHAPDTPWQPPAALDVALPDPPDLRDPHDIHRDVPVNSGRPKPPPSRSARPAKAPDADEISSAHDSSSGQLSVAALLAREGASKTGSHRHARPDADTEADADGVYRAVARTAEAPRPPVDEGDTDVFSPLHPAGDTRQDFVIDFTPDAAYALSASPAFDAAAGSGEPVDFYDSDGFDDEQDERAIPVRVGQRTHDPVAPERRRSRKPVYLARAATALIAVCSLTVTGGAWQWSNAKNNRLNRIEALDPDSRDIRDPNAQYGDENFLIIGVDTRAGANSSMGAGDTSDAEGTRSDTIMLVNIPANRKRVAVVSFPRDLAISPTLCETWNEDSHSYGPEKAYTETKLNSAFAYGGPKCLVKVIQKISGLNINRFLGVDFAGFSKVVDALGGVEVCSTTPIEDYELGTVLENSGRQTIDGHTALQYVRARQVTTEYNGDYGRIKRQQRFLSSLLRSMISQDTFFSLSKLNNVVNTFIDDSYVDNIKTKDLVDLGQSLQNVSAGRITFLTVPTDGTDEEGNETPRTGDIRKIFDAIIDDDPLPGELLPDGTRVPMPGTTSGSTTLTSSEHATDGAEQDAEQSPAPTPEPTPTEAVDLVTVDPGEITVHVSNSTSRDGLAASAADALRQYGFAISTTDDYPKALEHTTVFFAPGNEQQAATVAAAFGGAKLQRVSGNQTTVRVVLGSDFWSTTPPPNAGSTVSLQLATGSMAPADLPMDLTVVNAADATCD